MAKNQSPEAQAAEAEKKKIAEEKKKLKQEQSAQRKEAKRRAKEIAKKESELDEEGESNGLVTFFATLFIVILWLAVVCVIIKLDIGGFGSTVLKPILEDVPIVNRILPGVSITETTNPDSYGGYTNLRDAVDQIKALELEIDRLQTVSRTKDDQIDLLSAEILRLKEFEEKQVEFQRIRTEFYEDVVYAEKGPGAEAYKKYYESMDPTTAEFLYRQVIITLQESQEIQDYASAYSQMKPKQAAGIFEKMEDNLQLVARILNAMNAESRGAIMGVMKPEIAAKLTKIMDPES
ncbi:MAG: hypothetical protein J5898_06630 [Lachnospiraceae bacterium]|nr:hypothetical protein [Lachnospiraceae bacterium]